MHMKKIGFKEVLPFLLLLTLAVAAIFVPALPNYDDGGKYSAADISWILVATALVFLMTPGLAFFYGGMVHRKNVISTMMKSFVAAGVVSVVWIAFGYSLAFGDSVGGFIGNPATHFLFKGVTSGEPWSLAPTIPKSLFSMFQLMFAIITPGLVVGAVAERIRFNAYILFTVLFSILVYAPLAHWSWHPEGFLFKWGALDFAGGTVVHISAGCAALAGALVLKRRKVHIQRMEISPANVPYVLIGTGLLWFGWFGFNAGSALGANALAVSAFATTNTAAAAAATIAAVFARARLVDTQPTAPNLLVVQPGNGRFRFAVRGHLYKAEPFGLAALTIANDRRIAHSTIDLEGSAQFILGGTVRQISYVNVHKILFQRSGLKDRLASSTVGEAG